MFFTVQYISNLLHTRQNLGFVCLFTLYSINRENNENKEPWLRSPWNTIHNSYTDIKIFLGKSPGDEVDTDTNEFYLKFSPQFWISSTTDKSSWSLIINDEQNSVVTLSSAKTSAGYPNKYSNNRKIESDHGTMGGGKRRAPRLHFP